MGRDKPGTGWMQVGLTPSGGRCPQSMSLSQDCSRLALGDAYDLEGYCTDPSGECLGNICIFYREQQQKVDGRRSERGFLREFYTGSGFGSRTLMSKDGSRITANLLWFDGRKGTAFVIERDEPNAAVGWTSFGNFIQGEDRDDASAFAWDDGNRFGTAVSLTANGTRLAVHAPHDDCSSKSLLHLFLTREVK